jgi:hypothetical protein
MSRWGLVAVLGLLLVVSTSWAQTSVPEDDWIPMFVAYEDPSTGEQVLRPVRVKADSWDDAARSAAEQGAVLLRRTPELETQYSQQRRAESDRAYAEREGGLSQFAFSTLDHTLFGGLTSLTREIDSERGRELAEAKEILSRHNPGIERAARVTATMIHLLLVVGFIVRLRRRRSGDSWREPRD